MGNKEIKSKVEHYASKEEQEFIRRGEGVPMDKLLKNLQKELNSDKELIVLISTGRLFISAPETKRQH
jgi:hypothetical protein